MTSEGQERTFRWDGNVLYFDCTGGYMTVCVYQNSQNGTVRRVTFIVCEVLVTQSFLTLSNP